MAKIDIHNSAQTLKDSIERIKLSDMSSRQIKQILNFVDEAQIGKNSSKKVGNHRIIANLQSFLKLHSYFKKDLDRLTEKDIVQLVKDLENDNIKQNSGKNYKPSSKDELIRNLKRFLKTLWSDVEYRKKISWVKQNNECAEIDAITMEEVKKLSNSFVALRDKTLTIVLGDGGLRIEEALNLKIKDVLKKEKKNGEDFYILDIKVSKTLPRKISVPYATPLITKWLKEHPAITDKEAYLFPTTYDYYRKLLRQHGKETLDKIITPHVLRHSSATHYSKTDLGKNLFKFCYRYGWSMSSKMPKRYIDRNLFEEEAQEELDNMVKNSKVDELEKEVENIKKQRIEDFEKFQDLFISKFEALEQSGDKKKMIQYAESMQPLTKNKRN